MLSWSSIVLVHRNNISADRHVIPHGTHCRHSESTSPCFYSNSCVLAEKLQIHFCTNIIVKLNWPGFEPMIYYTWAKHISSHGYWQMLIDFFFGLTLPFTRLLENVIICLYILRQEQTRLLARLLENFLLYLYIL
jgi:hypothetical protein